MTNSIFNTKEQYFSFRNAWKAAASQKNRKSGWLQAEHHILFNIICGRSVDHGFTPITNKNKLKSGAYINHGLYFGMYHLMLMQDTAKGIVNGSYDSSPNSWRSQRLVKFLEPFRHTVTIELFASIELPNIEPLYSNFGKTKKIATKIIEGDFKPVDFNQIYDALAEVA
jgi:hypothetical protein